MSISERSNGVTPWLREPSTSRPPLSGPLEVDAVIIGAGYTGLGTALALREEGMSVAVLEAEHVGFGASGRNAGHLTPTIGKDLPTLLRLFGRERVSALVGFSEAAISYVENLIARHGIDCDYEAVGNVIAAVHSNQHANIDRAAEAAADFGIPGQLLDADAMEARDLPSAFTRGYLEPHGGILDPGKYVQGLATAATEAGAQIFEGSRVIEIEDGPFVIVSTNEGRVRARYCVIGTNAYTPKLKRPRGVGIRLQVQLFRTEPLSDAQLRDVGWRGREGVYTAHEVLESYRLTADNRILGGSKAIRVAYGERDAPDVDRECAQTLERTFANRFPELRGLRIERHWGGPIFASLDFLPVFGRSGRRKNVLHAVAYNGHGIAHASYAGRVLADAIAERSGPGRVLMERWNLRLPPEPVRYLVARGLIGLFSAMDRKADRLAHGRPRSAVQSTDTGNARGAA